MTPTIVSSIAMYPHERDYVKSLFENRGKALTSKCAKNDKNPHDSVAESGAVQEHVCVLYTVKVRGLKMRELEHPTIKIHRVISISKFIVERRRKLRRKIRRPMRSAGTISHTLVL
jgi:hypothetical protein